MAEQGPLQKKAKSMPKLILKSGVNSVFHRVGDILKCHLLLVWPLSGI